jgi:hypothetical protein
LHSQVKVVFFYLKHSDKVYLTYLYPLYLNNLVLSPTGLKTNGGVNKFNLSHMKLKRMSFNVNIGFRNLKNKLWHGSTLKSQHVLIMCTFYFPAYEFDPDFVCSWLL